VVNGVPLESGNFGNAGSGGGADLPNGVSDINPDDIADYISHKGFTALRRALKMKPARIVKEVKDSKLRGRGGAGFDRTVGGRDGKPGFGHVGRPFDRDGRIGQIRQRKASANRNERPALMTAR